MVRIDVRLLILFFIGPAGVSFAVFGGGDGPVGMPASQDFRKSSIG